MGNYVKNAIYFFSVVCFLNKPGHIIRLFQAFTKTGLEGCPILMSNRIHWKMGHNDSIDLSNGEYLYSIGKVQLTIRLLHVIS